MTEADGTSIDADAPGASHDDENGQEQKKSLEAIAGEMGPFNPPAEVTVEPEFEPPPPRPIPPALGNGPYAKGWRRTTIAIAGVAIVCIGFARNNFVQDLAYYVLPLKYLDYVGCALLAFVAIGVITRFIRPGRYAYVRDGVAVIARVLDHGYRLEGTKENLQFRFLTGVDFLSPEIGCLEHAWIPSESIGSASSAKRYRLPYDPGDYVTLVYLPGRFDKTARIYATLGLNPRLDYIRKDGKPKQEGVSLPTAWAIVASVIVALALLIAGFYAVSFRMPIAGEWEVTKRIVPFGAVLGTLGYALAVWGIRKGRRRDPDSVAPAAYSRGLLCFLGLAGGFVLGCLLAIIGNAVLDQSEPEYRDVRIVETWQVTYDFLFRNYEIEYKERATGRTGRYPARVQHMDKFYTTRAGVIDVRRGVLGLPFIRQIHPAVLAEIEDPQPEERFVAFEMPDEETGQPTRIRLGVRILLDDDRMMPVSAELAEYAWNTITEQDILGDLLQPGGPATRPGSETRPGTDTRPS